MYSISKRALISHLQSQCRKTESFQSVRALCSNADLSEKMCKVIKRTHQATIKIINVYLQCTHCTQTCRKWNGNVRRYHPPDTYYIYATFAFRIMTFRFICTDLVVQQSAVTCSRTTLANKFINVALDAHTLGRLVAWLHPAGWLTHADLALTVK